MPFFSRRKTRSVRRCSYLHYPFLGAKPRVNNPQPIATDRTSLTDASLSSAVRVCTLLARLPPEIRLQIWTYVIENNLYHIDLLPGRLGSRVCKGCTPSERCCSIRAWTGRPKESDCGYAEKTGIIPFLQTCRQVYNEGSNILYASGTFDISDLGTLMFFVQGVPPQRIRTIRNLRVYFHPGYSARTPNHNSDLGGTWELFWRIAFSHLVKLQRIRIYFDAHRACWGCPEAWDIKKVWSTRRELSDWDVGVVDTSCFYTYIEASRRVP